jgi:hypothetical protein
MKVCFLRSFCSLQQSSTKALLLENIQPSFTKELLLKIVSSSSTKELLLKIETLSQNLGSVLFLKIETLPIFLNNATGDESDSG